MCPNLLWPRIDKCPFRDGIWDRWSWDRTWSLCSGKEELEKGDTTDLGTSRRLMEWSEEKNRGHGKTYGATVSPFFAFGNASLWFFIWGGWGDVDRQVIVVHKDGVGVRVEFRFDVVEHSSKVEGSIDKRNILWRRATRNRIWVDAYPVNMLFLDMLNQGMQISKLQIAAAEVRALWPALSDRNINNINNC